jgi:hypothetical protein
MDKDEIIKELAEKNAKLEEELQTTKEHLKKYTAPASRKLYYESNKEDILEKMKANPTPPEKRKEYNRESYLRKKEKLKKKMEEKTNNENV